jgi:hypothetical protein
MVARSLKAELQPEGRGGAEIDGAKEHHGSEKNYEMEIIRVGASVLDTDDDNGPGSEYCNNDASDYPYQRTHPSEPRQMRCTLS